MSVFESYNKCLFLSTPKSNFVELDVKFSLYYIFCISEYCLYAGTAVPVIILLNLTVPAGKATKPSQTFMHRAPGYSKKSPDEIFSQSPAETGLVIRFPALHKKPVLASGFPASHSKI